MLLLKTNFIIKPQTLSLEDNINTRDNSHFILHQSLMRCIFSKLEKIVLLLCTKCQMYLGSDISVTSTSNVVTRTLSQNQNLQKEREAQTETISAGVQSAAKGKSVMFIL